MREKPINKIARLERQKKEWEAKYKAEHSIVRQLSASLKKVSEKASLIAQYEDTIAIIEDTNKNLKERISELESQIKKATSDNWKTKKDLQMVRENYDQLKMSIEAEKTPQRLCDFMSGKDKDRWGLSFFDDNLCPQINPYNGERIYINCQYPLLKVITEYYKEIWEERCALLNDYRNQFNNAELNIEAYNQKRDQLGREMWSIIEDDWRVKDILIDNQH